jgi:uncharacterized protein DUF2510
MVHGSRPEDAAQVGAIVWLMSDSTASAASAPAAPIPPGWYDDGTGSGRMRWWSGVEWTEHVAALYSTGALGRPVLPADRPLYNAWIWLVVLLPLLSSASFFLWQPNFDYLNNISSSGDPVRFESGFFASLLTPGYFVIGLLGWAIYAVSVFFAYRDVVWLRRQGVERPFHWAWTFLLSWVYVIGRSVIVHRVAAPRGRAPIWVMIAVIVASLIITTVWTVGMMYSIMSGIMANLPDYSYTG